MFFFNLLRVLLDELALGWGTFMRNRCAIVLITPIAFVPFGTI